MPYIYLTKVRQLVARDEQRLAASHRAVREMKADGLLPAGAEVRSSKYLNNLTEQRPSKRQVPDEGHAWLQAV